MRGEQSPPAQRVYYESIKRDLMPALSTFLKLAFKPVFDGKSRLKDTRLLALS